MPTPAPAARGSMIGGNNFPVTSLGDITSDCGRQQKSVSGGGTSAPNASNNKKGRSAKNTGDVGNCKPDEKPSAVEEHVQQKAHRGQSHTGQQQSQNEQGQTTKKKKSRRKKKGEDRGRGGKSCDQGSVRASLAETPASQQKGGGGGGKAQKRKSDQKGGTKSGDPSAIPLQGQPQVQNEDGKSKGPHKQGLTTKKEKNRPKKKSESCDHGSFRAGSADTSASEEKMDGGGGKQKKRSTKKGGEGNDNSEEGTKKKSHKGKSLKGNAEGQSQGQKGPGETAKKKKNSHKKKGGSLDQGSIRAVSAGISASKNESGGEKKKMKYAQKGSVPSDNPSSVAMDRRHTPPPQHEQEEGQSQSQNEQGHTGKKKKSRRKKKGESRRDEASFSAVSEEVAAAKQGDGASEKQERRSTQKGVAGNGDQDGDPSAVATDGKQIPSKNGQPQSQNKRGKSQSQNAQGQTTTKNKSTKGRGRGGKNRDQEGSDKAGTSETSASEQNAEKSETPPSAREQIDLLAGRTIKVDGLPGGVTKVRFSAKCLRHVFRMSVVGKPEGGTLSGFHHDRDFLQADVVDYFSGRSRADGCWEAWIGVDRKNYPVFKTLFPPRLGPNEIVDMVIESLRNIQSTEEVVNGTRTVIVITGLSDGGTEIVTVCHARTGEAITFYPKMSTATPGEVQADRARNRSLVKKHFHGEAVRTELSDTEIAELLAQRPLKVPFQKTKARLNVGPPGFIPGTSIDFSCFVDVLVDTGDIDDIVEECSAANFVVGDPIPYVYITQETLSKALSADGAFPPYLTRQEILRHVTDALDNLESGVGGPQIEFNWDLQSTESAEEQDDVHGENDDGSEDSQEEDEEGELNVYPFRVSDGLLRVRGDAIAPNGVDSFTYQIFIEEETGKIDTFFPLFR